MELDKLKDLWNKEEIQETPEISLEEQREIHSPLEKIRKNMRIEFWYTILSYPLLFIGAFWYSQQIEHGNVLIVLTVICGGLCAYYFCKFNSLYQKINTQDFSTFHKLLNLRYELVLNTELYKSYYVCYIPIFFCSYLIMFGIDDNSLQHLIFIVILTVIASALVLFFGKVWLREFYGKYIIQISDLVMELSGEKDDFVFDRKSLKSESNFKPFKNTARYFDRKFGDLGVVFNLMLWLFIGTFALLLAIFIVMFIVGLILGFMSHL